MQHASVSPKLDQHCFTSLHQFSTTDFTRILIATLNEWLGKGLWIMRWTAQRLPGHFKLHFFSFFFIKNNILKLLISYFKCYIKYIQALQFALYLQYKSRYLFWDLLKNNIYRCKNREVVNKQIIGEQFTRTRVEVWNLAFKIAVFLLQNFMFNSMLHAFFCNKLWHLLAMSEWKLFLHNFCFPVYQYLWRIHSYGWNPQK